MVGQHVNVLSATELFTFKWLILCELHLKEVLPPPGRGIPKPDFGNILETKSDVSAPVCLICPASDALTLVWDSA